MPGYQRLGWQKETDYGKRALVETAMGRYKAVIGTRLRARSFSGQEAEAAFAVAALNRMLDAGCPDSVRRLNIAAQSILIMGKLGRGSIHATTPPAKVHHAVCATKAFPSIWMDANFRQIWGVSTQRRLSSSGAY